MKMFLYWCCFLFIYFKFYVQIFFYRLISEDWDDNLSDEMVQRSTISWLEIVLETLWSKNYWTSTPAYLGYGMWQQQLTEIQLSVLKVDLVIRNFLLKETIMGWTLKNLFFFCLMSHICVRWNQPNKFHLTYILVL